MSFMPHLIVNSYRLQELIGALVQACRLAWFKTVFNAL